MGVLPYFSVAAALAPGQFDWRQPSHGGALDRRAEHNATREEAVTMEILAKPIPLYGGAMGDLQCPRTCGWPCGCVLSPMDGPGAPPIQPVAVLRLSDGATKAPEQRAFAFLGLALFVFRLPDLLTHNICDGTRNQRGEHRSCPIVGLCRCCGIKKGLPNTEHPSCYEHEKN
jgi:hypothetical protein